MDELKGIAMAENEPMLTNPSSEASAAHVKDYTRFTKMLKWGAIACFIIAMLVLMIIS
jgi:hypothetical protein